MWYLYYVIISCSFRFHHETHKWHCERKPRSCCTGQVRQDYIQYSALLNHQNLYYCTSHVMSFCGCSVNEFRLLNWLGQQEDIHRMTLYQCDYTLTKWTKNCIRQADCILIVGLFEGDPAVSEVMHYMNWDYSGALRGWSSSQWGNVLYELRLKWGSLRVIQQSVR